jgi:hypothetical protein
MSKPEDIPQDVWLAANSFLTASMVGVNIMSARSAEMVSYAILAERERCAQIADGIREEVLAAHQHERAHAVECVAVAIRNGAAA